MRKYQMGVADFDAFVSSCPYFNDSSPVNNGYGCNHPGQDEKSNYDPDSDELDENGLDERGFAPGEYGECHCYSCPYGYKANTDDVEEKGKENDPVFWDDLNPDPDELDDYLIIPVGRLVRATPEQVEAWVRYQKYMNRYNSDWKQEDALALFDMPATEPTDQDIATVMFYLGYEVAAGTTAAARNLRKKTGDEVLALAREYAKSAKTLGKGDTSLADYVTDRINHDKRLCPDRIATMECDRCGQEFRIRYLHDGSYEYVEFPCGCDAEYHPVDGEPSISEWLESLF